MGGYSEMKLKYDKEIDELHESLSYQQDELTYTYKHLDKSMAREKHLKTTVKKLQEQVKSLHELIDCVMEDDK
tara:strand:+ start:1220 stop:1438 length:219 start_codon:yes stop_codon:yes gene_type:complete